MKNALAERTSFSWILANRESERNRIRRALRKSGATVQEYHRPRTVGYVSGEPVKVQDTKFVGWELVLDDTARPMKGKFVVCLSLFGGGPFGQTDLVRDELKRLGYRIEAETHSGRSFTIATEVR